ncbi:hypothetical protein ABH923_001056 [Leifsonia sp. EB41]
MKVTPTAPNTLRSVPPQLGQTVSASSVNAWWMSKAWPQSRHE